MVLLAAVADSAERIENNVMVLDKSPTTTVKGK